MEDTEWNCYHPSTVIGLQTSNNVNTTDTIKEELMDEDKGANNRREMTNDEDNGRNEQEDNDVLTDLLDETPPHLSHRAHTLQKTFRRSPKLQSTKSFPPYSQPIGGLGYERDSDPESESDYETADVTLNSSSKRIAQDTGFEQPDAFRLDTWKTPTRCSREELRARLKRSSEVGIKGTEDVTCDGGTNVDGWERRERWIGKRRPKETGEQGGGEGTHHRRETKKGVCDQEEGDTNGISSEVEEEEGLMRRRMMRAERKTWQEGIKDEVSQPHPILAKLLHSSGSSSSSFSLYSAESEEVYSEGEDTDSRLKTLRKCFSWKTLKTIISLGRSSPSSWVQLAGHQGNFQLSDGGEVLKLYSETEAMCLDNLMRDPLRPFVPQYHGLLTQGEERFIRMEDLLDGLTRPIIMDCKMGIRTYQEDELVKCRTAPTLRSDMYHKMLQADPGALSAEEHEQRGVTKLRYLRWRDTTSSTSALGFRIEGIMMENGNVQRDFRKMLSLVQVTEVLLYFTRSRLDILRAYHCRLQALGDALERSSFFSSNEVIGSSLLFVHDYSGKANVWMIDFGKTTPTPESIRIRHNVQWTEGNREDGYLIGLASLTSSLHQAITLASQQQ
ncbi:unnamed protein product [Merluccius merluccius]